jgi:hypothetical protein
MAPGPSCVSFTLGALPLTSPEGITHCAAALNHSGKTACRVPGILQKEGPIFYSWDGEWDDGWDDEWDSEWEAKNNVWAAIKMLKRRWPGIKMK